MTRTIEATAPPYAKTYALAYALPYAHKLHRVPAALCAAGEPPGPPCFELVCRLAPPRLRLPWRAPFRYRIPPPQRSCDTGMR